MVALYPAHAHRPGSGQPPDRQWLEDAKAQLADPALVDKGVTLLRAGYFWEAHELLEKAWLAQKPNSPAREMLRALIQIANGLLKQAMDAGAASRRLFEEADTILLALPPGNPVYGFKPAELRTLLSAALEQPPVSSDNCIAKLQKL